MLRVILISCFFVTALAAQTVEGHVVNAATGAGISGATVEILQYRRVAYTATTDSQGRFRIESLKEGVYSANYEAPGFWSVPDPLGDSEPPFLVATGRDPVRLEAKMQPIGKLSGRVLDAAGKPVPNATVWFRWGSSWCKLPTCRSILRESKTGEKGEYSITDLDEAGAWLLSATAPPSWNPPEPRDGQPLGWMQTFYPSELLVRPASDLSNLDIKLATAPVRHIRGTVIDVGGDPVANASVTLGKNFGPSLHHETKGDGAFEFEFAAPIDDEWHLSATITKDGVKQWAAHGVEIKGDAFKPVELRLAPGLSIPGNFVIDIREGTPAPKLPQVFAIYTGVAQLADTRNGFGVFPSNTDAKGDFTLRNLSPGPHIIRMAEPPVPPYYLDSIRLGELDALASDVPIHSGAQPVTITLKLDGGTVRGTIEACAGGDVVLMPQDPALRSLLRRTTCAQNGRFEFLAVRPGEYYGYAIAGKTRSAWRGTGLADGWLSQAIRISVRAGESTAAEIPLLKAR